ncbi:ankyrin repeat domain-containing protein SOWAHC [Pundamilia nyererei]|uniref:Ankyrin repeat domain-containing protein SOWAHC n=1 Tax=Pundamilia nyererei TaxID=303518 RepID=A0A9Y3QXY1_9CICH|nr:PREDICTED: ankyrin repeat domain-containing protein SOWAHC [Pundamilia nyererei]XP_026000582.1 ankyrin repeat domain-containing protein SOWAHC [Astatotilapia calliptera]
MMMMASRCTVQAVQEFLSERGGRVQQMELIDHFLSLNEQSKEGVDREVLKSIVDSVGFVKVENGVKFVCLNSEGSGASVMRTDVDGHDGAECNGNIQETLDNNCVNGNHDKGDQTGVHFPLDNDKQTNGNKKPATPSQSKTSTGVPTPGGGGEVKLRDRRRRESAPVLGMPDLDQAQPGGSHNQQTRGARRVSRGSQRAMLTSCLSEDSALEGLDHIGDIQTPKGSRRNFIELMMSSSPQVRRSLINRGSRLRDSVKSEGDSASLLSSATDEDCASVTLDPLEHEWMLCASDGLWDSLQPLLAVEPSLVTKRDFVTGFTCLHWAAKQGKAELLSQLLTFAKENTIPVNVNVRSSAGYTPLHLAAMHGHTQVVRVLLSDWDADPEARDYSGRRPMQYLSPPLAADLLEEGVVTSPGPESDSENNGSGRGRGWRFAKVLQGNLNPLRLLNSPTEASEDGTGNGKSKGGMQRKTSLSRLNARLHRGRHRAQIIHSASFRDTGEVGRGEELHSSPLRTRPLSNLFG